MRQRIPIFGLVLSLTSFLFLCPLSFATKSRLSAMGELSIVIEDESDMINLWDFSGNPAGFLADEKGSVIRGDFLWDRHNTTNLRYYEYYYPGYTEYSANGNISDTWVSGSFRRDGKFALGAAGNYLFRETDSRYEKQEQISPGVLLIFSKSINPQTSFGANLQYAEDDWEYMIKDYDSKDQQKTKNLGAEIGVGRRFTSGVILGALLGYESFEPDEDSYLSNSYSIWFSGQTIVEVEDKLKLGTETIFKFERADFREGKHVEGEAKKKQNYYFSRLKFRGIYDFSTKFRVGLFFFNDEPFFGFYEPIYWSFPFPPYEYAVTHWGAGCSYRFNNSVLAGVEYHFRDYAFPRSPYYIETGLKSESFNLGVEGKVAEGFFLRGGYIRTETNQNPNLDKQRDTWENAFTLGFGYEPQGWDFTLEFSYGYAFKKFKQWYTDSDVESGMHRLSLSLKKVL
jgi:hypothetical protein